MNNKRDADICLCLHDVYSLCIIELEGKKKVPQMALIEQIFLHATHKVKDHFLLIFKKRSIKE